MMRFWCWLSRKEQVDYYDFFTIHSYIYYTKNTCGLWPCLGWVTSRKCFQDSPKGFKTILSPQIIFYTLISVWCFYTYVMYIYTCTFSYFFMFSTSQYSRLETFIIYSIRLLSMLYTHSLHLHPFQVRFCLLLLPLLLLRIVVELVVYFVVVGGYSISLSTGRIIH